jgi:SAM-dependent methyltransferase
VTIAFYDEHAQRYCDDTVGVDLEPLYARFLAHMPAGGALLDAGCGSGRDARWFRASGYRVEAFDASPALAALATQHCGLPVAVRRFQDIDWQSRFDGVWACASLLHVPRDALPDVLRRLARTLKPGGVLYASFKYGRGECEREGRRFTDLDEAGFAELLDEVPVLGVIECWISRDARPQRGGERWLNALLRASAGNATELEAAVDGGRGDQTP